MPNNLITIQEYSKEEILGALELASKFEKEPNRPILSDKVVASLFYEPSTRTKLSFESAAGRLGAKVIGFSDTTVTSETKGESLRDTIKIVTNYADLIVIRHPLDGSARFVAEIATVPVINAGDGTNQHPTQTLLDLYSILKTQGRLENLQITIVGDLKYGRTVHSLIHAMSHFSPSFIFVSPHELRLPQEYRDFLTSQAIPFKESSNLEEGIEGASILYMTRVQKERFSDPVEYEKVKESYRLTLPMLKGALPNMKILHPLPRVNEIEIAVDDSPHAYYFQQAENGIYVRMAIMASLLLKRVDF
ncbi:MAG: aspartate carbamoyltransferase [Bacteroidales bacterium]